MPYNLDIHTIDVGQGESSLIIADDAAGHRRVMLIDGGLASYAQTVHTRVAALAAAGPDHIVVTHYDKDHSGGITALLIADNLYKLCDMIAGPVATSAVLGANRAEQVALGSLAACAVMLGAYNDLQGHDHSAQVGTVRSALLLSHDRPAATATDAAAASSGIAEAEDDLRAAMNPTIGKTTRRRDVSKTAGIAAADAIAAGGGLVALGAGAAAAIRGDIRTAIFDKLKKGVGADSRFQTGGIYAATHLIDTGATNIPDGYQDAVGGSFVLSGDARISVPGITRQRTSTPNLGAEILWNSGPNAGAAPANSPAVFVVARNQYIWQAPARSVPIAGGLDGNGYSIGMVLRFNGFFFYTGGDLTAEGEDLVATAVMGTGLPNPAGGTFATPHRIAAFKCGHHGADTSTSQNFLNTITPRVALISCGRHSYQHPHQNVVNRLHGAASVHYFYLTNCKFVTNHVPASNGNNQLVVGNYSRVAGDNADDNLAAGRQRGNIRLSISQGESNSALTAGVGVLRQFHVTYYDNDPGPVGNRTEDVIF